MDTPSGLTHAAGLNLNADATAGTSARTADFGTLVDRETGAKTKRKAGGVRIGYGLDKVHLSTGLEYRFDETQQLAGGWADRMTYVLRNNVKYQITPDWRVVAKLNYALSNSSLGQVYDGGYTEGVLGWAYRPVDERPAERAGEVHVLLQRAGRRPVQPAAARPRSSCRRATSRRWTSPTT